MRTVLAMLCLCVHGLAASAEPAPSPAQTTVSLDQARVVARNALYAGQFELAREIAMALIAADPEDAYAYGVLAAVHSRLNDPKLARAAARLSYRYSDTAQSKFGAARTAASVALQQDRPTFAQAWLRLAATHAETPQQETQIAREYRRAKAANPLQLRLSFSIAPSGNVNSGTDNVLEVINGVPTQGVFQGSSRALSGVVLTLDTAARYRLTAHETAQTTATARVDTRRVDLSSSSAALVPGFTNSDFGSTYAELGLERMLALRTEGHRAQFGAAFGASWSGGDRSYDFAKLNVGRGLPVGQRSRVWFSGSVERRFSTRSEVFDRDVLTLGARYSLRRDSGDRLQLGLTVQNQSGDFTNADFQTASLRASYTFAQSLGPAQVTAGLTLGYTDFDTYRLVSSVDGGREDQSIYGDVSFFFADYDFAGFAPTLNVRTGRRSSNVNRFEIDETTLTIGIRSKF